MCRLELYKIIVFCSAIINVVYAAKLTCRIDDITDINSPCGENELCSQKAPNSAEGLCKCKVGYERVDDKCHFTGPPSTALPDASSNIVLINDSGSNTTLIICSVFVILVIGVLVGIYYAEKTYRLVSRFQSRFKRQNQSSYDEVMIGQEDDDPPIA